MKRKYVLFRRTYMTEIDTPWEFVTVIEAVNIIDAEDKSEEYILPNFYYVITRIH